MKTSLFFLLCLGLCLHVGAQNRKNTVSIFYSVQEEFHFKTTSQKANGPAFGNIAHYNGTYHWPFAVGVSFKRRTRQGFQWRIGWTPMYTFSHRNMGNYTFVPVGSRVGATYTLVDIAFIAPLLGNEKTGRLQALLLGNLRSGRDYVQPAAPVLIWSESCHCRRLTDAGTGVGLNYTYNTPRGVSVSLDMAYKRWLYLSNHHAPAEMPFSRYYALPQNAVDIRFSVGYSFGSKNGN